jgi:hypothetical protein
MFPIYLVMDAGAPVSAFTGKHGSTRSLARWSTSSAAWIRAQ